LEVAGGRGLKAICRHLRFNDDHEIIASEAIVNDALSADCQEMLRRDKSAGESRQPTADYAECSNNY
jgi:hypothetical protein